MRLLEQHSLNMIGFGSGMITVGLQLFLVFKYHPETLSDPSTPGQTNCSHVCAMLSSRYIRRPPGFSQLDTRWDESGRNYKCIRIDEKMIVLVQEESLTFLPVVPTSVHAPKLLADCHVPLGTTIWGDCPPKMSGPRVCLSNGIPSSFDKDNISGAPA